MIEIRIFLQHPNNIFHHAQHIYAYVRDCTTDEFILIDYSKSIDQEKLHLQSPFKWELVPEVLANHSVINLITNNNKDIRSFIDFYNDEFLRGECCALHNCSHAVNMILDYFFEKSKTSGFFKKVKNYFCCCLCITTCGCKCFRSAIKTPHEVFKKALKIHRKTNFRNELEQKEKVMSTLVL